MYLILKNTDNKKMLSMPKNVMLNKKIAYRYAFKTYLC